MADDARLLQILLEAVRARRVAKAFVIPEG